MKILRCQVLSARLQTFLSTKCLRHFQEKKSFQFVSSLFGVWSWSRNSWKLQKAMLSTIFKLLCDNSVPESNALILGELKLDSFVDKT